MSHTMKVWERIIKARLRDSVEIIKHQYGFMLHCVFVDPMKTYNRVSREELWYCMRKSGTAEKYVRLVHDMYEGSKTVVRCERGTTQSFMVKVGLHQRSTLSPFLFAVIMDKLTDEVRRKTPWRMLFADDIVI